MTTNHRHSAALHLNRTGRSSPGGSREVVQLLIEAGADVVACDNKGVTALQRASTFGTFDIVRLLIGRGADAPATAITDLNTTQDYPKSGCGG